MRGFWIVFLLALVLAVSPANQAQADTLSIAVVDVDKILADSQAAQSLQKQIQGKKESFQKEFSAREKELKTTEDALLAEREKLSAEEFATKRKAYEEKILETRKLFQKRRNSLDEGLNKAMQELRKNIVESAAQVADEKGYDIVLTRESVLIAEKSLDITTAVLAKLNGKISNIPLPVE